MPHVSPPEPLPPLAGKLLAYHGANLIDTRATVAVKPDAKPVVVQVHSRTTSFGPTTDQGHGTLFPRRSTLLQVFDHTGAYLGDSSADHTISLAGPDKSIDLQFLQITSVDGPIGILLSSSPLKPGIPFDLPERPFDLGDAGQWRWVLPARLLGVAGGCMIDTPQGAKPADTLSVGDLVKTSDQGFQPLIWVGKTELALSELKSDFRNGPIHIPPQSLGLKKGKPLICGLGQLVSVRSEHVQRLYDLDAVSVPAQALIELPGVTRRAPCGPVSFVQFQVANGSDVEVSHIPCGPVPVTGAYLQQLPEHHAQSLWRATHGRSCGLAPKCLPLEDARELVALHAQPGSQIYATQDHPSSEVG